MAKLCLNLIDENTIGISEDYSPKCKIVIMAKSQVKELLEIEPFEKLNERLFLDYGFLFRKEIQEIKNGVSEIIDPEDDGCMTNLDLFNEQ